MKAVVAAFNQEKALVGAFSVITNLRMEFGWNFLKHYLAPDPEAGLVEAPDAEERLVFFIEVIPAPDLEVFLADIADIYLFSLSRARDQSLRHCSLQGREYTIHNTLRLAGPLLVCCCARLLCRLMIKHSAHYCWTETKIAEGTFQLQPLVNGHKHEM